MTATAHLLNNSDVYIALVYGQLAVSWFWTTKAYPITTFFAIHLGRRGSVNPWLTSPPYAFHPFRNSFHGDETGRAVRACTTTVSGRAGGRASASGRTFPQRSSEAAVGSQLQAAPLRTLRRSGAIFYRLNAASLSLSSIFMSIKKTGVKDLLPAIPSSNACSKFGIF